MADKYIVYGIGTCTSIRKEINKLKEITTEAVEFYDYLKQGLSAELLKEFVAFYGWKTVVNARSQALRNLPQEIKDYLLALDGNDFDEKAYALLKDNVRVIKRPLIRKNSALITL